MGKLILERPTYREVTALFRFTLAVDSITIQFKCEAEPGHFVLHSMFDVDPESLDAQGWGQFKVPLHPLLDPGKTFELRLCGMVLQPLKGGILAYKCVEEMAQQFRSELTRAELKELQRRAVNLIQRGGNCKIKCPYMARNKRWEYYQNIMSYKNGIMETYIKDNNGDPASVINGTIHGLFFATKPQNWSFFGRRRLNVPARLLINRTHNLYFADFYCNQKAHYVTLLSCRNGSDEDLFCREKLLLLNIFNNPFLRIAADGSVMVTDCYSFWVEVFVTENINIPLYLQRGAKWETVNTRGRGTSRPSGLPKRKGCPICNLYL